MPCAHTIASSGGDCFLCLDAPTCDNCEAPLERIHGEWACTSCGGMYDEATLLAIQRRARIAQSKQSLAYFLKHGWHVLEPDTPLEWGWHIQTLCDHIQALIEDQWRVQADKSYKPRCQNLNINVPPGTLKSRVLSVYAPAWAWLHKPSWRLLALSSNPVVADRDADYSKQLIESSWYKDWFAPTWEIRKERDAIRNFANTAGGYRISRGLNATVTGLRGDAIFVDDPNDVKDISDTKLDAVARNWRAASNRVNHERSAIRVMIQQRTHEKDLTGSIFDLGNEEAEGKDWHHLVIPMEREIGKECVSCKKLHGPSFLGWVDPRKEEGDVLQPERNTPEVLAAMRRKLGPYGYAGQAQQRPTPLGGGMFKTKWWGSYDSLEPVRKNSNRPRFDNFVISVDANFKEGGTSRAAIVAVLGLGPKRFVLKAWADSVDYPTLKEVLVKFITEFPYYSKILIEDKANGSALIAELKKSHRSVIAVNPEGGKVSRANACIPTVAAGDVYLPRNAPWREDFVQEHAAFPRGRWDDFVDALSQALTDMQELGEVQRARSMGTW